MQNIRTYKSYLIIIFAFAMIGMLFSFAAQRGGINQLNGFIAPIIGPWSRILEPNAYELEHWEAKNFAFAISVSIVAIISVLFSSVPKNKTFRVMIKVIAYAAVVFWCICGMMKVVTELT